MLKTIGLRIKINKTMNGFASIPVVSVNRFAARPVGAYKPIATFFARKISSRLFTKVVFPTLVHR